MKKIASLFVVFIAMLIFIPAVQAMEGDYIVIDLEKRQLTLYKEYEAFVSYPVGVGRSGFGTPTGAFEIIRKVKNPQWQNPYKSQAAPKVSAGTHNPIGTRWIGFKAHNGGEYGIHGTNRPSSVGQYSSHGCVRMITKDAEELFEYVSLGMSVIITKEKELDGVVSKPFQRDIEYAELVSEAP